MVVARGWEEKRLLHNDIDFWSFWDGFRVMHNISKFGYNLDNAASRGAVGCTHSIDRLLQPRNVV